MRQIIQRILASERPRHRLRLAAGGRAGSAGVYIAYASQVAAMAPNTNIGSATPVAMGEDGEQQNVAGDARKVTNDAAAYIRSLAEQRGRNADWAERGRPRGCQRHGPGGTQASAWSTWWPPTCPTCCARSTAGPSRRRPAGRPETASAPVQRVEMGAVDAFLHAISDPTIAYILLSLGTMGLFFELSNPGSIFPASIGAICLLLGFYALGTLPVNYAGLLLMGFAFLLFVVDLFAPSHGILTVGGLVAFLLGSLMLFNVPEAAPWFSLSLWTIFAVTAMMGGFFLLSRGWWRAR